MNQSPVPKRLSLPEVTLVAVTSVNVEATLAALKASLAHVDFGACKLLTDAPLVGLHPAIELVPIAPLTSSREYSDFMLRSLADHIETSHCLVVQWDGYVVDASRWQPEFLDYDYLGASWPQFSDGHDVGNGGFSLRSRRLLEASRLPEFEYSHPEDIAIARINRSFLEGKGLRFAPSSLADFFSAERASDPGHTFGYHGVWHMPRIVGAEAFWNIYRGLDDRTTVQLDFASLLRQLAIGPGGARRSLGFAFDRVSDALGIKRKIH